MKDLIAIAGLVMNMAGCGMLYLDAVRVSARISPGGIFLGEDMTEEDSKQKARLLTLWSRGGFMFMGLGFALQILAIYAPE